MNSDTLISRSAYHQVYSREVCDFRCSRHVL